MKNDPKLKETIVEALYKESKKEGLEYRRHAWKAFTEVLHELDEDKFTQVHDIALDVLPKVSVGTYIRMDSKTSILVF